MPRKNPNGYGGITKLSGNRRKPYMAYTSEIIADGVIPHEGQLKHLDQLTEAIKGTSDVSEIFGLLGDALTVIYSSTEELDKETAIKFALDVIEKEKKKRLFTAKQKKKPIGYFATYKEASIVLADYNKDPSKFDHTTTFGEVWALVKPSLKIETKTISTHYAYKMGFDKCAPIHDTPMKFIKTIHLQSIVDQYSHFAPATQSQILQVMHAVYRFAVQNDIVDRDYSQFVTIPKREPTTKTAFTPEEVQIVREHLDYTHKGVHASVHDGIPVAKMVLVLIFTGLRITEMLSLKTSDVNLDHKYLEINGTKTANAVRIVPIHKEIEPIIQECCTAGSEYLFPKKDGRRILYNAFNDLWRKFSKTVGIKNHTIHETRHTFATYSAIGMNAKARAFIIGHKQGITDDLYTHPKMIADQLKTEIDKMTI